MGKTKPSTERIIIFTKAGVLKGFPEKVMLRGQIIVDGNTWYGKKGQGKFIRRKPFAEIL
jgi:hypothetical protein